MQTLLVNLCSQKKGGGKCVDYTRRIKIINTVKWPSWALLTIFIISFLQLATFTEQTLGNYNTYTDSSCFLNGKSGWETEQTIAFRKRVASCWSHNDLLCLLTSEAPWQLWTSEYQGRSTESKGVGKLLGEGRKLRKAEWEMWRKPNRKNTHRPNYKQSYNINSTLEPKAWR